MRQIDIEIECVVEAILGGFEKKRETKPKQPVKTAVIDMLEHLQRVLFPGYFGPGRINGGSLKNRFGVILEDIFHELTVQVGLALRYNVIYENSTGDEINSVAANIAQQIGRAHV